MWRKLWAERKLLCVLHCLSCCISQLAHLLLELCLVVHQSIDGLAQRGDQALDENVLHLVIGGSKLEEANALACSLDLRITSGGTTGSGFALRHEGFLVHIRHFVQELY